MPRNAQAGFTLIEVMVAFIIAALAIGMLYGGAAGGMNAAETAARVQEALDLAQSHLAEIGHGAPIARQESSGADGGGFDWRLHIAEITSRELTLLDTDRANDTKPQRAVLFDIAVTESWKEAGHPHSLTLRTRRFDIVAQGQ